MRLLQRDARPLLHLAAGGPRHLDKEYYIDDHVSTMALILDAARPGQLEKNIAAEIAISAPKEVTGLSFDVGLAPRRHS